MQNDNLHGAVSRAGSYSRARGLERGVKSSAKKKKRIMIVEGHPLTRMGLAQAISGEPDFLLCFEAESAEQAIGAITTARPDLVITGIALPGRSGLELIKDIKVFQPRLPVVVFSLYDEFRFAERALRAGGRGYIMKHESASRLIEGIRKVLAGGIAVSDNVSGKIIETVTGLGVRRPRASIVEQLTDREFQIFQLIGNGKEKQEIARLLHLSTKTVDVHSVNIKRKLNLKTTADLIRFTCLWTASDKKIACDFNCAPRFRKLIR